MTTAKAGPGSSVACPWITSILRILIRPVSPRTSLSTTFFWNASTPSQSGSPDALIPHSWDRFTLSRTAADWSRAFVGMQPRSRHVPPRRSSRSMSATRLPSSAARRAHAYPPVPAPRIATSYGVSATQPSYRRRDVPIRRARNRLRVRFPRGRRRGETDAARGRASRPRREDGAVRGMAHAHRVPRHAGRARGGPGALDTLQRAVTNDVAKAGVGQAQYNTVLNERGGIVDDLIVYRLGEERYFVVPNAANTTKVHGI